MLEKRAVKAMYPQGSHPLAEEVSSAQTLLLFTGSTFASLRDCDVRLSYFWLVKRERHG